MARSMKARARVARMVAEVEQIAKDLRADVRKRAKEARLPRMLQKAAARLCKQAASAASGIEKYAHQIRAELESQSPTPGRRVASKARKPKRARMKRKTALAAS